MSSEFGKTIKVSIFGESHRPAVGAVIDGLPAGENIDTDRINRFLARRRPGTNAFSSARTEPDEPEFLSGIMNGKTCGTPLCAIIRNHDIRSEDYESLSDTPRPGHADYTAFVKWNGSADMRGGGHFSGRLTAPLCIAGAICIQILERRGIYVGSHLAKLSNIEDDPFPLLPTPEMFKAVSQRELPVINPQVIEPMQNAVNDARENGDSVGGIIECAAVGVPAGLGSPMFNGMESRLAGALYGIPAVKGVEFGAGFAVSGMFGSENNDAFSVDSTGKIVTLTNNCGGILGGITNGMPVVFRVAVKPTPSISRMQQTVDLSTMQPAKIQITGRHDPCIAPRAAAAVEAAAAIVLLDALLEEK